MTYFWEFKWKWMKLHILKIANGFKWLIKQLFTFNQNHCQGMIVSKNADHRVCQWSDINLSTVAKNLKWSKGNVYTLFNWCHLKHCTFVLVSKGL